nr:WD40 repeat domain containing protein [Haemonchus contortus]
MLEQNAQKKSRSPSLASLRNGSISPSRTDSSEPLPYRVRRHTATADEMLYPAETAEPTSPKEPEAPKPELPVEEEKKEKKQRVRQGRIVPVRPGTGGQYRVVTRTATVEGHSKAVLSVAATDELLLSGSKDRTAKLWDLQTGSEVRTLGVHPNNVHAVRFIPDSQLAISVSMYQIRVWDLRTQECVRMLQSSGQVNDGDGGPAGSRQNTVPFLETVVNAAEVDPKGKLLFTSFGGDVRIWNLDKWASFGRLVGAVNSPRSEVSCMAVSEGPDGLPQIFTGSRDHYVKMFQCSLGGEGVYESTVDFNPPHYDNVTCVVPFGGFLLTAGKDKNIMKFSLLDQKRDHLELNAHNSFIQGMCLVGTHTDRPLLCSVCKEGTMKFWDITTSRRFKLVEELPKAHSESIYSVCSNKYMVFTASSDQTIGFWKLSVQD